MKRLFLVLSVSFVLIMAHDSKVAQADGVGGIPLFNLVGKYATTSQGSTTICFKPDFSGTESCSTSGAVPIAGNGISVGQTTFAADGSGCGTATSTFSFPGDPLPTTGTVAHSAIKLIDYDPATGSGDQSITNYTGGKCVGAEFDSTSATVLNTLTIHLVASDGGRRIDIVVTTQTDPVGDIGAFNVSGFDIKQ